MDFNKMCKIAYDFLEIDGFYGVYLIKDIGDALVFYGGNPNEVFYGLRTVSVEKKTGKVEWFDSNYYRAILDAGQEVEVPQEFDYLNMEVVIK